jgi:molybdopterin converting factor small subunit
MKISIKLKLEGYIKYKYPSDILELNYSKPVTIYKVLKDAKISSADVFFIKVGDLIVKEDYLLTESAEIKLFPIIGGG